MRPAPDDDGHLPPALFLLACGPAGIILLGGYVVVSRLHRRHGRPAAGVGGSETPTGIVFFGATFVVLSLLNALGLSFPGEVPAGVVSLAMLVTCAVRMFRRLPRPG